MQLHYIGKMEHLRLGSNVELCIWKIKKHQPDMNKSIIYLLLMALPLSLSLYGCAKQEAAPAKAPIKVKTCIVKQSVLKRTQAYPGTIEEISGTSLSFPTMGTVSNISIQEGQKVRAGQLIAELDETTFRSAYSTAEAMLSQAQDAYQRMKLLHDNNSLPEIQWVEVQSKLRQAQSAEEIARKNLADSKLYVPFSGVISKKRIDNGQNVMPGQEIARLVKIDHVKVCVPIPENEISGISIGEVVEVIVPALDNRTFVGTIVEKGIAANPITRTYDVKATVSNTDGVLMPGMLCSLYFDNGDESQSIIIPSDVILLDNNNNNIVWINKNGKAEKRIVTTGTLSDKGIQIISGLNIGDELITEGYQKISENMRVSK